MLKQDRAEAQKLASLAEDYLASGGAPTLCPPADAAAGTLLEVDEAYRQISGRLDHRTERGWTRDPRPKKTLPLLLGFALIGLMAALIVRRAR